MSVPTQEAGREMDERIALLFDEAEYDVVIEGCSRAGSYPTRAAADADKPKLAERYQVGATVLAGSVPRYSSDVAAAFSVVEKLTAAGHDIVIRPNGIAYDGIARVEIGLCVDGSYGSEGEFVADAPTVPLAICRAALAAAAAVEERRDA